MLLQLCSSSSTPAQLPLFLPDAVVPGPGLQLWEPEAGKSTKQETVTLPLNLCQNP